MALQAQTSDDPDDLPFTAADCDGLNLSAAIRKFVFEPLARELGEAVDALPSDGWVWMLTAASINAIADPAERAEARQAFNRTKRQLPDYSEAEYMAVYAQKIDGRRFCDKRCDGDVLDILAFQKHARDLPSNKAVDFIWPIRSKVEDILPALYSQAEPSKKPIDTNAIRLVATRIAQRFCHLTEFLQKGELVATGIRDERRERIPSELWSDREACIDVRDGKVDKLRADAAWTDPQLFVPDEPLSTVIATATTGANGDSAEPIASPAVADPPQRQARSPKEERKNAGGRPLSKSKAVYTEIIQIANTPDGLPARDELTRVLQKKFPAASESNMRSILREVYNSLKLH